MTKCKLNRNAARKSLADSESTGTKSHSMAGLSATCQQEAIRRANGRCQMCGSTVERDGANLVVDDSRPKNWGGNDRPGSLWAICEPCCAGTKAYLSSVHLNAESLRKVTNHKSVHVRIGELLKAVGIGNRVPSSLIEAVAYQDGWQKRLRELRYPVIGWEIGTHLYKGPSGKRQSDYLLISCKPWPRDPSGAIRKFEKTRALRFDSINAAKSRHSVRK